MARALLLLALIWIPSAVLAGAATYRRNLLAVHWGDFASAECVQPGYRKYYSRLWDISGDWKKACWATPATIKGQNFDTPTQCDDKGAGGMWGVWQVRDSSCDPNWGPFKADKCTKNGYRQYSSILWNIKDSMSWENACAVWPATINDQSFTGATRCVNKLNIWGEFDVADASCLSPESAPNYASVDDASIVKYAKDNIPSLAPRDGRFGSPLSKGQAAVVKALIAQWAYDQLDLGLKQKTMYNDGRYRIDLQGAAFPKTVKNPDGSTETLSYYQIAVQVNSNSDVFAAVLVPAGEFVSAGGIRKALYLSLENRNVIPLLRAPRNSNRVYKWLIASLTAVLAIAAAT